MAQKGRSALGEKNGWSKLTAEQVLEIRRRYAGGALQRELAAMYDVSRPLISLIVNHHVWKHLKRRA